MSTSFIIDDDSNNDEADEFGFNDEDGLDDAMILDSVFDQAQKTFCSPNSVAFQPKDHPSTHSHSISDRPQGPGSVHGIDSSLISSSSTLHQSTKLNKTNFFPANPPQSSGDQRQIQQQNSIQTTEITSKSAGRPSSNNPFSKKTHAPTLFIPVHPFFQPPSSKPSSSFSLSSPFCTKQQSHFPSIPSHASRLINSRHAVNQDAIKTWVYPTNRSFREYQFNIVQRCLFTNTLVALPTGLGKTLIAAVVMYNYYRWFERAKIVFMAPTKPLVAQQIEACYNVTGIPQGATCELTGATTPEIRKRNWKDRRVFFLTPQVFQNDLKERICDPHDIALIVVDEAHRATGKYAYCEATRCLMANDAHFRVLALSATPGSDVKTIQNVITNLCISRIEIRTEDSLDIRPYTHQRNISTVVCPLSDEIQQIQTIFRQVANVYIEPLIKQKALFIGDPDRITNYLLLESKKEWRKRNAGLPPERAGYVEGLYGVLGMLISAYQSLIQHGILCFYNALQSAVAESQVPKAKVSKAKLNLFTNPSFKSMMSLTERFMAKPAFTSHVKVDRLEEIVSDHFKQHEAQAKLNPELAHGQSRVIIFSQYRASVDEIVNVLKKHEPLVRTLAFVGQANSKSGSGGKGISQKEQLKVIESFSKGNYNVLVSTSIGEEGLDIGEVDLIVCFDSQSSPIRLLQRMGRTGRKREGRVVVLLAQGREEESYKKATSTYKSAQKTIIEGQGKKLQMFEEKISLLPVGCRPVCEKKELVITEYQKKPGTSSTRRSSTGDSSTSRPRESTAVSSLSSKLLNPAELNAFDRLQSSKKLSLSLMQPMDPNLRIRHHLSELPHLNGPHNVDRSLQSVMLVKNVVLMQQLQDSEASGKNHAGFVRKMNTIRERSGEIFATQVVTKESKTRETASTGRTTTSRICLSSSEDEFDSILDQKTSLPHPAKISVDTIPVIESISASPIESVVDFDFQGFSDVEFGDDDFEIPDDELMNFAAGFDRLEESAPYKDVAVQHFFEELLHSDYADGQDDFFVWPDDPLSQDRSFGVKAMHPESNEAMCQHSPKRPVVIKDKEPQTVLSTCVPKRVLEFKIPKTPMQLADRESFLSPYVPAQTLLAMPASAKTAEGNPISGLSHENNEAEQYEFDDEVEEEEEEDIVNFKLRKPQKRLRVLDSQSATPSSLFTTPSVSFSSRTNDISVIYCADASPIQSLSKVNIDNVITRTPLLERIARRANHVRAPPRQRGTPVITVREKKEPHKVQKKPKKVKHYYNPYIDGEAVRASSEEEEDDDEFSGTEPDLSCVVRDSDVSLASQAASTSFMHVYRQSLLSSPMDVARWANRDPDGESDELLDEEDDDISSDYGVDADEDIVLDSANDFEGYSSDYICD